jgi:hypothetical protein
MPRRVYLYNGPSDGQTVVVDDAVLRHGTIYVPRPPKVDVASLASGGTVTFTEDAYRIDPGLPPLEGHHAVAVWTGDPSPAM